jgi:uncharacterized protein YnzC (UPF0291/DUF896 family)
MNLRDMILGQSDLPRESVTIPEWKDGEGKPITLFVRTLTSSEKEAFEKAWQTFMKPGERKTNVKAKLATLVVVDENGSQVFTENDIETLGNKNTHALERIYELSVRMNKKDVEELEKNSQGIADGNLK